jgi:hypothetical protein
VPVLPIHHLPRSDSRRRSFFDALDRTSTTAYLPSDDDILRSRVKSTGIMESAFLVGETTSVAEHARQQLAVKQLTL